MEKCSNCKQSIDQAKLLWHETMCKKTMKYCEDCQEPIELEEFDQHLEDYHTSQSTTTTAPSQSKLMKEDSFKREKSIDSLPCSYCNLLIVLSEYEDHEQYCAAIQGDCVYCNKPIQRKEKEDHEIKCMIAFTEGKQYEDQINDDEKFARLISQQEKRNRHDGDENGHHLALGHGIYNSGNYAFHTQKGIHNY